MRAVLTYCRYFFLTSNRLTLTFVAARRDVAHLDVAAREVARTSERNAAAAAIDTGAGATASGLIPSPGKDTS